MGEVFLALLGLLLLVQVGLAHWRFRPHGLVDPPRGPARLPSITVIRPIRGLDACERENLAAALDYEYPGDVETLFVLDDESDPATPLVREALGEHLAAHRVGEARLLFAGAPPAERTGKLNAMIVGLRAAKGELVAFADSDTRSSRSLLAGLVRTLLGTSGAGAAFAPVLVAGEARTVGDVGYALMLNGLYGPAVAVMAEEGGGELPFIMGQFMVLRREALAAIGGLECAQGQLVDDMYLGLRLHAAGYHNVVGPERLAIIAAGLSLRTFAGIFLRWIAFSRSGLPTPSKQTSWLRGVVFWLGLLAAVGAALAGAWWAAACNALVPLATAASINALHRRLGGTPIGARHAWVAFAVVLCAPVIYLRLLLVPEVEWRGRRYRLDAGARLAVTPAVSEGLRSEAEAAEGRQAR